MVLLAVKELNKSFGGPNPVRALANVDLEIGRGEFGAIVGPSGCGKTTLLKIIAGIERPDSGRLIFDEADISELAAEKRHFGFVFQSYALFPNLTVFENIAYGLRGARWPKAERQSRVEELIEMGELGGLAFRYPGQLSGGQQQRVALARALAPKPRLLLLDEPLSALDAQVRLNLGRELRKIQRQTGVTSLMVTHDQKEALALADKVILMNKGRIIQAGAPEDLYNSPNSRFGAEFVGHMNIISLGGLTSGRSMGLRYEDVEVFRPTENALSDPDTWVAKVESAALMGSFYRLELLLNDFATRVFADVPRGAEPAREGELVAVRLPRGKLYELGGSPHED